MPLVTMMRTAETGFGPVEYDDSTVITITGGLLGFPNDTEFVLLEHGDGELLGYLQSLSTPALAFPVMDPAILAPAYPQPAPPILAQFAGLSTDNVGMLVIVVADEKGDQILANLVAPLVIDVASRTGVQVLLEPSAFPARFPIATTDRTILQKKLKDANSQSAA